jgi:hypothetical protein
MIKFAQSKDENIIKDVLDALDRWYIAVSSDGCLWIQPRRPVLSLLDFCVLIKRIHRIFNDHRFDVVIFHFDGVQAPRSVWAIVLRLLTALAKSVETDCRVIRSVKVNAEPPADFHRVGNAADPADRLEAPRRTVDLKGISVVMETRLPLKPLAEPDARTGS